MEGKQLERVCEEATAKGQHLCDVRKCSFAYRRINDLAK